MVAMTLPQMQDQFVENGEHLRAEVAGYMIESDLIRALPLLEIPGGAYTYLQEGQLPGMGFKNIPASQDGGTGVVNPQVERLRVIGGVIDTPRPLMTSHGANIARIGRARRTRAWAYRLTNQLINGDTDIDPRNLDGLRSRIAGSMVQSAGHVGLSRAMLDESIKSVDDASHLLMATKMLTLLDEAGWIVWKDEDPSYVTADGDFMVDVLRAYEPSESVIDEARKVQYEEDNSGFGTDQPLGFNEANGTTSIYALAISDQGVIGLTNDFIVDDLGYALGHSHRLYVQWMTALGMLSGRAGARVGEIAKAPVIV